MQRWIRLSWVGLTNSLLLLPIAYFFRGVILYGSRWGVAFLTVILWWDFIVGAVLGFVLDAMQAKSARLVNIGIWIWLALKFTAVYFSLWTPSTESRGVAAYLAPLAWTIATVNFFLYRSNKKLGVSPASRESQSGASLGG
jgi:hypothetical protein